MTTLVLQSLWPLLLVITPGQAWLRTADAEVHAEPNAKSPIVGELRHGDRVMVSSCSPSCEAEDGWALLGSDGAVLSALLQSTPTGDAPMPDGGYSYGKVIGGRSDVYEEMNERSRLLRRVDDRDAIALVPNDAAADAGWSETFDKGYVRTARLRLLIASPFSGEHNPQVPLAFFVRDTHVEAPDGSGQDVARFDRMPVLGLAANKRVSVEGGTIPRSAVRMAFARPRPQGVGPSERWVHVDLREQVLTAYEGDQLVFATLVSTGRSGFQTSRGLFRVWRKVSHDLMHSEKENYRVEEVPWTLYFRGPQALHGAFWHDHFGSPVSHGCVNLSMADAAWLFSWAPPPLPDGWHAIVRPLLGEDTLWVKVERAALGTFPSRPPVAEPPSTKEADQSSQLR